jgi:hypothetical protein
MRGATSQQAKSRSGQTGPWILWKELFYWCKNHSDKVLMISIKFLFKDSKCGRKGEVPASSIKRNQNIFSSLIHRVYQWAIKPTKGFIKFQKQIPLFSVADPWHFGVDPDPDPRIHASWLLDPDPDPGSGPCYFRHWPSRCQQKTNFLTQYFLIITFWSYIYTIFQR